MSRHKKRPESPKTPKTKKKNVFVPPNAPMKKQKQFKLQNSESWNYIIKPDNNLLPKVAFKKDYTATDGDMITTYRDVDGNIIDITITK